MTRQLLVVLAFLGACSIGTVTAGEGHRHDGHGHRSIYARCAQLVCEAQLPCVFCGDGVVNQASEECDDGNDRACDGCTPECRFDRCADGYHCPGPDEWEECDDGNTTPCDGCSPACAFDYCGDGYVCGGEECEPSQTPWWKYCEDGPCRSDCTCPVPSEGP